MKAEYRREMNHSYLVLKTDGELNMQGYEMKMLLHNQLAGLLPFSVRYIDGEPLFYYEITSRQSLLLNYEVKKFGKTDLERIFRSVADIMEELEEYLLDAETILFNPKYIYMDTDWQHLYFCCFPVSRETGRNGVLELTEYILPKIDHKDAEAVVLGYGVYRESVEAGIGSDEICRELRKVSMETADEKKNRPENPYEGQDYSADETITEEKRKQALDDFFQEEEEVEEKHPLLNAVGCIFTLAAAAVCIYLLLHYEIAGILQICIGVFAASITAGGAFIMFRLKNAREEKRKKKRELDQLEAWGWEQESEYKEDDGETEKQGKGGLEKGTAKTSDIDTCGPTILLSPKKTDEGNACLLWDEEENQKRHILDKEIQIIGKLASAADICLGHPAVSRIHGRIRRDENNFFLSGLNSKNGTFLNGRILEPEREYLLHNGDKISIAGTELQYCNFQNKAD